MNYVRRSVSLFTLLGLLVLFPLAQKSASASADTIGSLTATASSACAYRDSVSFTYTGGYIGRAQAVAADNSPLPLERGDPNGSHERVAWLYWVDGTYDPVVYKGSLREESGGAYSYFVITDLAGNVSPSVPVDWTEPAVALNEDTLSSPVGSHVNLHAAVTCADGGSVHFVVVGPGAGSAPPDAPVNPSTADASYSSSAPGTDSITATYDLCPDGVCTTFSSSPPIQHQWTQATVSVVLPPPLVRCVGTPADVVATVREDGNPLSDTAVDFDVSGSAGPTLPFVASTDGSGNAAITYTRSAPGVDTVSAAVTVAGTVPDPATAKTIVTWDTCALTALIQPRDAHKTAGQHQTVSVTVQYQNAVAAGAAVTLTERMLGQANITLHGTTGADGTVPFVLTRPVAGTDQLHTTVSFMGRSAQDSTTIVWDPPTIHPRHTIASVALSAADTQCVGTPVDLTATVKKGGVAFNGAPVTFRISGLPTMSAPPPATSDSLGLAIASYLRTTQTVDTVTASARVTGASPNPAVSATRTIHWVPCILTAVIEPRGSHHPVGQQVSVQVTVRYRSELKSGAQVTLTETMFNQPTKTVVRATGSTGQATFVLSRDVAGIDHLTASATYNGREANDATSLLWEKQGSAGGGSGGGGGGGGGSSTPPPPNRSLTVGNGNPVGGSRDTATGHGCPASQPVVLALDGSTVARTTADSGGKFRAAFVAPDRPIGRHWLKARCGTVVLSTPVDYVSSGSGGAVGSALPLTTVAMLGFFVLLGLPILRPGAAVHHP